MTDPEFYLGIDPGMSGGIAFVSNELVEAHKMPETERDTYDLVSKYAPCIRFALIERVHSMPKQGVASSFKFGRNYGFLRGVLIATQVRFDEITPQAWQKAMGCMTGGDKNISKSKAQQLFPKLKCTHAIADALLIAQLCYIRKGNGL